ncbi:unnamed protein product [Penicillium salamii]|nr:unnamed protein product [Penicillium salamii]CAG7963695.1 unnamed protein product [Penicillium salamii]CAG7967096.1 unnamed protein product [Penicillium salamii]CAG7984857.1 unnamed protein product [Penicillium salamii]CAG8197111.1 unnamed protein product [Penicillium salamii]
MIYCLPSPGYHFFYFLSSFDKRPTMPTHLDASGPRHVNNHHMTGKLCLPLLTSFLHFNLHHLKTHQPHDNMLLASWPSTWPLCFIIHRHPLHATHASGLHHAAFHHIHGSLVSLVLSLSSHFLLHFDILTPSQDTSTTQHATYILLLQCALHLAVHRRRLHATHASGLHYPASHHIAACVISLWLTDHSNTQPHATSMLPLQRALHLAVHRRLPHATQTSGLYYAAFHHIYGLLVSLAFLLYFNILTSSQAIPTTQQHASFVFAFYFIFYFTIHRRPSNFNVNIHNVNIHNFNIHNVNIHNLFNIHNFNINIHNFNINIHNINIHNININIHNINIHNINIHNINIHNINIHNINIHNINIHNINIHNINIHNINIHNINIHNINIHNTWDWIPGSVPAIFHNCFVGHLHVKGYIPSPCPFVPEELVINPSPTSHPPRFRQLPVQCGFQPSEFPAPHCLPRVGLRTTPLSVRALSEPAG